MKKIILAAMIASLGSVSAFAADIGARPYTKTPMMAAPISTWQGLYIGGNVGYGWGDANTSFSFFPSPSNFNTQNAILGANREGVIGGAQIGYNWQASNFVYSLEADIQGSGIKGSVAQSPLVTLGGIPILGTFRSAEQKLSWFGTVRGRLGVSVTSELLIYGTGGLAYGQVDASANTFFLVNEQHLASLSKTKAGWTAGGGVEWAFARNWSAKVEYLYLDLGNVSAIGTVATLPGIGVNYDWKTQENIVRFGVNYKFGG